MKLLKLIFKYIPLLIELRLSEWHYNLLMFDNPFKHLVQLVKLRQRIDELRTKISEL